jgi:hypothetical protein
MNFFRTVFALCAHFRNYRAVRDLPVSQPLLHLIKLVAVLTPVLVLIITPMLWQRANTLAAWADRHFPEFRIEQGRVTSPVAQPHRAGDDKFRFILDTTGTVTGPDSNAVMGLLVRADDLVFWLQNTNTSPALLHVQEHPLRGFPDGRVNGDYFRSLVRAFLWVAVPLGLVVGGLIALLGTLLQAYLFSLFGSLLERGMPGGLQMPQLLNVALYAATPATILFVIYFALQLENVNAWLLYLMVYGVYVIGATNSCRERQPAPVVDENDPS